MRKLLLLLLLSRGVAVCAQDVTKNISPAEAKTLLQSLSPTKQDTGTIDILLRLSQYNILKPGEDKPDLDSAAAFLFRARQLNAKINSSVDSGYIAFVQSCLYRERGMRDPGKKSADSAIAILKNSKDNYHLGEACFERAQYDDYDNADQAPEKIHLVEQAVQASKQSSHVEFYAYALKYLADLYQSGNQLQKALETAKLSLQYYNSIHYPLLQGVYVLIAKIYQGLGDFQQALAYELDALKLAESAKDTTMELCEIYDNAGVLSVQIGEKEKAIYYFEKALPTAENYKEYSTIWLLTQNIVYTYNGLGKSTEALKFLNSIPKKYLVPTDETSYLRLPGTYLSIYMRLKRYPEARIYCKQLIDAIKRHKADDMSLLNSYDDISKFFLANRQFSSAALYIRKFGAINRRMGNPFLMKEIFNLQFKLDSAEGNFESAVHNLQQFHKISDSLYTETKSRQIKQLEIQYETRQKEEEIKIKDQNISLLNQKSEVQQLNLRQAVRLRNETLAGSALLLILGGLFYGQYRQKLKTNRIISTQNADITRKNELLQHLLKEKEWLLKEVHHRVKNNLHTVICLLESQAASLESDALKAFENSQHRIYAMSLIHQKLYQSEDIKTIDMSLYLPEFIQYLKDSFDTPGRIVFFFDIEPIKLGISQAIPIALIINEAVTNAIKYAFNGRSNGRIEIRMHRKADQITLTISDNGVGIDPLVLMAPSESLGLKLMNGLSEDINGDIRIITDDGTTIKICFAIDLLANAYHPLSQAAIQD